MEPRRVVLERRKGPVIAWLVFVGALVLLAYAARLTDTKTPDNVAYQYSSSIAALVQYGLMLAVIVIIARVSRIPLPLAFALRQPASWKRALGLAFVSILAIYVIAFAYERILSLFGDWSATDEQGLVPNGWDSSRAGAFVAFFVVVTFVAPAIEEMTFRGLGISVVEPYGVAVAVALTGVLFGAAHGLVVGFPVLAMFGIVVGWLRVKTDSVYPGVILHAAFNGIALIAAVSGAG